MLFLRRFLTTFKRLERLFSQLFFTSVLNDINTRGNNENQDLTTKQRKKIALDFYQFLAIVTRSQIYRIPVNNEAYDCIPEITRPEIREKRRQKKIKKFYFKFAFLTRLVPLEIDLSPGKQAQR